MKLLSTFLLSIISLAAISQEVKISGQVSNETTGEVVADATVSVLNSRVGTLTDTKGRYELSGLVAGTYEISVRYVGYATQKRRIALGNDTHTLDFVLVPETRALDGVIVTSATKQEVAAREVPASITRIDAEAIDKLRVWNQRGINALTGNLTVVNAGEGDGNNYSIRGVTSLNFDPSVTTYVDGVNQFNIYSNIEFLHDVESIEILKGPQGTLFGRNAIGGVINITTRPPSNQWRGKAEASFGNYNLWRYNASVSGPIVDNKLYFAVAGLLGQQDGYFTNTVDNTNFNSREYIGGSASLRYNIADRWAISFNGKAYQREVVGYVPYAANDSVVFANPFEVSQDAVGNVRQDWIQASLKVDYTGSNLNFSNILSYQSSEYTLNNVDIDFTPLDFNAFNRPIPGSENTARVVTNELTFSNPASAEKIKWIAGSYAFRQELPVNQIIRTGEDAVAVDPSAPNQVFNFNEGTNSGVALFGQVSYAVTDQVEVIGGIRYDYEERETITQTDFIQGDNPRVNIMPQQTRRVDFGAFSPKLGLNWLASNSMSLYAIYSRGYRIGGINPSIDPRFEQYDPETSDNFELGMKGKLLGNTLNYAFSAFYINRENIQTQVFEPVSSGINFITLSTGDGRNLGLEMELSYLLTQGLQVSYHLGLLDAEYTRLEIPDFSAGGNQVLAGKTVIFSPPVTSNLIIDYTKVLKIGTQNLVLNGNIQWVAQGRQFFDFNNTVSQDAYSLINGRVGAIYAGVGLHFWTQNLFDEQYIQWAPPIGAPTPYLGAPTTFGLSFSYQFN